MSFCAVLLVCNIPQALKSHITVQESGLEVCLLEKKSDTRWCVPWKAKVYVQISLIALKKAMRENNMHSTTQPLMISQYGFWEKMGAGGDDCLILLAMFI